MPVSLKCFHNEITYKDINNHFVNYMINTFTLEGKKKTLNIINVIPIYNFMNFYPKIDNLYAANKQ